MIQFDNTRVPVSDAKPGMCVVRINKGMVDRVASVQAHPDGRAYTLVFASDPLPVTYGKTLWLSVFTWEDV